LKLFKIKIDTYENNFEFIIIRGYHYGKDKSYPKNNRIRNERCA